MESKQFQAAKAAASQLELAAQEAGVIEKKKSSQPVRGTEAWDDAMVKARGQAERYVRASPGQRAEPAVPAGGRCRMWHIWRYDTFCSKLCQVGALNQAVEGL